MTTTIGELRERIAIQLRTLTPDGGTSHTEGRATISGGAVSAKVRPIGGKLTSGTVNVSGYDTATHAFTVRFRTDVERKHSILWRSKNYRILRLLDDDGMRRFLKILTEEEGDA